MFFTLYGELRKNICTLRAPMVLNNFYHSELSTLNGRPLPNRYRFELQFLAVLKSYFSKSEEMVEMSSKFVMVNIQVYLYNIFNFRVFPDNISILTALRSQCYGTCTFICLTTLTSQILKRKY